jgi:hypothetical protein
MPLILAIEPDKRQQSQLKSIVRARLKAELVVAETAERGLQALGDRVPDLILTTALLSPKDEAALDARLRELDTAASHVHTLTIPVLATPKTRKPSGGMLSVLRRERSDSMPDGCDPAVFAEQCAEYLERAIGDRRPTTERSKEAAFDRPETADRDAEGTLSVGGTIESGEQEIDERAWRVDDQLPLRAPESRVGSEAYASRGSSGSRRPDEPQEPRQPYELHETSESLQSSAAPGVGRTSPAERSERSEIVAGPEARLEQISAAFQEPFQEPTVPDTDDESPAHTSHAPLQLGSKQMWPTLEGVPVDELLDGPLTSEIESDLPPFEVVSNDRQAAEPPRAARADAHLVEPLGNEHADADPDDEASWVALPLDAAVGDERVADDLRPTVEEPDAEPLVHSDGASWTPPADSSSPPWAALDGLPDPAEIPAFDTYAAPGPLSEAAPAEPDLAEWVNVVESLQHDMERLQSDWAPPAPTSTPASSLQPPANDSERTRQRPAAAPAVAKSTAPAETAGKKASRSKKSTSKEPVQDEWGFFDPEQCGFAALLTKLEEITDDAAQS